MPVAVVEEKIRRLPEYYVILVNDYIDQLLERTTNTFEERRKAGEDLLSFAGKLRADIDEEKELSDWRQMRFGTAN